MIDISIIVPVYNVEKYLAQCLDSLINQTKKEIEIICVNDGSTDNSGKILAEYAKKDKRIKIITQKNAGLSEARNTAMKHVKGKYVGFVDSDDWVDVDFYEKLFDCAEANEADIAVASIALARDNGKFKNYKLYYKKFYKETKTAKKYKLLDIPNCCYVWNKIYRNELLQKFTFPAGRYFEDILFSHKIAFGANKVVCVPKTKYYYRLSNNSITQNLNDKKANDFIYAIYEARRFLENNDVKYVIDNYYAPYHTEFKLFGLKLFTLKKWENAMVLTLGKKWKIFEVRNKSIYLPEKKD